MPLGAGLINDSYRVKTVAEETPDYVLQRINHAIFQDVDLLQENIRRITEHIRRKLEARGGAGHGTEDADGGSGEGREAVRVRRRDILADDGLYPGLENV